MATKKTPIKSHAGVNLQHNEQSEWQQVVMDAIIIDMRRHGLID